MSQPPESPIPEQNDPYGGSAAPIPPASQQQSSAAGSAQSANPFQAQPVQPTKVDTAQMQAQAKQALNAAHSRIGNPLPSIIAGFTGYGAGLLMAIVVLALSFVALLVMGNGDGAGDMASSAVSQFGADDFDAGSLQGMLFILGLPAQLVSMAFFGRFGVHLSGRGELGSMGEGRFNGSIAMFFVPALVGIAVLAGGFIAARFAERRSAGSSTLSTWVNAALAGFAVACLSTIITFATAFRMDLAKELGIPEASLDLSMHAGGFLPFFMLFLGVTLAVGLGRTSARLRPHWWPRVSEVVDAFRLFALHALLFTVVSCLALIAGMFIRGIFDGADLVGLMKGTLAFVLFLPLIGGQVVASLFGPGLLSAIGLHGEMPVASSIMGGPYSEYFGIFSFPEWWQIGLALIIAALVTVAVALVWSQGRMRVPGDTLALATSWIALPLTYFVGGIVLMLLLYAGVTGNVNGSENIVGSMESEFDAQGSVSLAAWTPLLAALAGIVIELLARFAMPFLAPYVPDKLGRMIHAQAPVAAPPAAGTSAELTASGPTAAAATAATATGAAAAVSSHEPTGSEAAHVQEPLTQPISGAEPATVPFAAHATSPQTAPAAAHAQPVAPAAAPKPMSPKAKRTLIISGAAVGGLVLFAIASAIVVSVLNGTVFSPKNQVETYLTAVQQGRFGDAAKIAPPNIENANRVMLTNEIGKGAKNRLESFKIKDVKVDGDVATVTASTTTNGVSEEVTYTVHKDGTTALIFPEWKMKSPTYQVMEIEPVATTLVVNGQDVDISKAAVPSSEEYGAGSYGETVPFAVLPGTYSVAEKATGPHVQASTATFTVPAAGQVSQEGAYGLQLNDAGKQHVNDLVKQKIDACFKDQTTPELSGEGCEDFSASAWSFDPTHPGSWKINSYPTIEVIEDQGGWYFTSTDTGEAEFSYKYQLFDTLESDTATSSLSVYGTVIVNDKGEVEVEYEDNSGF